MRVQNNWTHREDFELLNSILKFGTRWKKMNILDERGKPRGVNSCRNRWQRMRVDREFMMLLGLQHVDADPMEEHDMEEHDPVQEQFVASLELDGSINI